MYNETLTTSFTYQQTAVPLFTYSNNEYTHITDIERKFYEDVLTKYIRIGSVEHASTRAFVKQKLETCNGQPNVNCDAFQCYLIQGKFITDVENFNISEQFFVDCVNNNKYIT